MSDNITKRVGLGTAYGFAKAGGYEGTVAEFTELLGNIAIDLARIENLSVTVTTLPAGSQATASLNGSVLSLGIPKGDKGDKGNTGATGSPAGFGTVSATVDDNIGTPSVEVTASGADTAKNFDFAFHNLKGQKGDKGDTGDVTLSQLEDFTVVQTDENIEPYNFRATPKCGHIERLKKVVGVSVAFNQLVNPSTATADVAGVTMTESDGVFTFTTSVANEGIYFTYKQITEHKYLYSADIKETTATDKIKVDSWGGDVHYAQATTSWQTVAFMVVASATRDNYRIRIFDTRTADWDAVQVKNVMVTDLTLALGSTIADYVYSLEQATAGSGVAWLKQHFPKMFGQYNAYDAGSIQSVSGLVSHDVVGFNQWDEEWEVGEYDANGEKSPNPSRIRNKNKIPCLPNTAYYFTCVGSYSSWMALRFYNEGEEFILTDSTYVNRVFTTPSDAYYMSFNPSDAYGNVYNHDICINISDTSKNGTYEPYVEYSYPLDSDLTLRGMLKISNGNLYADGDEYGADGVSRERGIADLGSLNWYKLNSGVMQSEGLVNVKYPTEWGVVPDILCSKYVAVTPNQMAGAEVDKSVCINPQNRLNVYDTAYTDASAFKTAMSGVYLEYPLATPTTETADPFTENQICEAGGTEEFVSTSIVPIGHETEYPLTLADTVPTANGNYVLKCTVTNGKASYEWASA